MLHERVHLMIQVRCTKKVQDFVGVKKTNLFPITKSNAILGSWIANIFVQDRQKVICFMNERTLLSFIITGVKKSHAKNVIQTLPIVLEQLLTFEGISPEIIKIALRNCNEIELTATDSRKLLGNMSDLIHMYQLLISMDGGLNHCDLTSIIKRINRTPQRVLEWRNSIQVTHDLLACAT